MLIERHAGQSFFVRRKNTQNDDMVVLEIDEQTEFEPLAICDAIYDDIDKQIAQPISPAVLDNTAEIVVQYGYITLFFLVFPAMPLLALVNNYVEQRVDAYNLFHSRRPVPFSAKGIGVWRNVISAGALLSVFTNMALLTFRTNLVSNMVASRETIVLTLIYVVVCSVLVILMFVMRFWVPDVSIKTQQSIQRQQVKFYRQYFATDRESDVIIINFRLIYG